MTKLGAATRVDVAGDAPLLCDEVNVADISRSSPDLFINSLEDSVRTLQPEGSEWEEEDIGLQINPLMVLTVISRE